MVGGVLVAFGWLWKVKGSSGELIGHLGPLPGITSGDLLTAPLLLTGLTLVASVPGLSWRRRAGGAGLLVACMIWVTSELPWDDPLVPGLQFQRHGVHLLDALAAVPLAGAVILLSPGIGPWWTARRRSRASEAGYAAR